MSRRRDGVARAPRGPARPEPPPAPVVPDVDPLIVLAVHARVRAGVYPAVSVLARELGQPAREVQRALRVLEDYVPDVPPPPRLEAPPLPPRAPGPRRKPKGDRQEWWRRRRAQDE